MLAMTSETIPTPPPDAEVMLTLAQIQVRWQCDRRTVLKLVPLGLTLIRFPFGYRATLRDIEVFEARHKLRA